MSLVSNMIYKLKLNKPIFNSSYLGTLCKTKKETLG